MGSIVLYILEWAFALVVLLIIYKAAFSGTTFYRFNRFYLLGATLLSALLPLVHVTVPESTPLVSNISIHETDFAQELSGTFVLADAPVSEQTAPVEKADAPVQPERKSSLWAVILVCLYSGYVIMLFVGWARSIIRARRFLRGKNRRRVSRTVWLVTHDEDFGPFSWMNYIVISDTENGFARRASLKHEFSHIRLLHSADLVFLLACTVVNPVCWLVLQEIKIVHEFEADNEVITRYGIRNSDYQKLLIMRTVGAEAYALASSFNLNIKKRIIMMNKMKTRKGRLLWLLLLVPMLGMTSVLFARTEEAVNIEDDNVKTYCDLKLGIRRNLLTANKVLIDKKTADTIRLSIEQQSSELFAQGRALEQYIDNIAADADIKIRNVDLDLGSTAEDAFVQEIAEVLLRKKLNTRYTFSNSRGTQINVSGDKPLERGVISGTVKDENGPMQMVNVTERDASNQIVSHTVTGPEGEFRMRVQNPDNILLIHYPGYYNVSTPFTGSQYDVTIRVDRGSAANQTPAPKPVADANGVYENVDVQPQFPGGTPALMAFMQNNYNYPAAAREAKVQGRTIVSFLVSESGGLSDFRIERTSGNDDLDNEALRMLKSMPNWKPAEVNRLPVKARFQIPVNARLN